MLEERGTIDGDLEIADDTRLYGSVSGDVAVKSGKTLIVHGAIGGALILERGSIAHVYGTVQGDVVNRGAELRVWRSGTLRGTLRHRSSETKIEAGAQVRALVPPDAGASTSASDELTGFRVLIAEDDDLTRDELASLVQSCGGDPLVAKDGAEAYDLFVRERPDAVVSDLWMATADGYALVKRIRSLPPEEGGLTPAIAMTASSGDAEERVLMAGYHAHLVKPFEPAAFVACVRAFRDARLTDPPGAPDARWAVHRDSQGRLVLVFHGHVRGIDVAEGVGRVAAKLEEASATVVVDARDVTGFDASVGSAAERAVWSQRRRIEGVIVVTPDRRIRIVAAAACLALGVPCSTSDEPPSGSGPAAPGPGGRAGAPGLAPEEGPGL